MAATEASPATDEPVKATATKTAAKKAPAKKAPAKRAAKKAPAKKAPAKAASPRGKKDESGEEVNLGEELDGAEDLDVEPGDDLEDVEIDDLETDDEADAPDADSEEEAEGDDASPAAAKPAKDGEDDIAEPTEKDKASGDFVWDEEESEALRQARKDAELTASADSVRAYLKQIGKVALLNAEEEVELAKRIEAGLYATQLMTELTEKGEKLPAAQRRDMQWICRDGDRAKNHLLEANLRLVVSLPSATPAAVWRSWT